MIKKIICLILCFIFAFFLVSCGTTTVRIENEPKQNSMFIRIEGGSMSTYWIVYHKDTKVMYAVSTGGYSRGNFTLLVNPDGSPMLWEGTE